MNDNHLILGLGGTGGKIIRAFKKTVFQEFRNAKPDDVNIEYFYIDSSDEMMKIDDPSWKIFGKNLQLGKQQQLLLKDANLSSRLTNIHNFPGISKWIGSREDWQDILMSIIGETLGGQKRRLGRFLFACKITEFLKQLNNLVSELQKGQTAVTFHICAGLAGGTGSGSIIDVISQIRDKYPDPEKYRIILYTLLPDTYPQPDWDTGNYHANGYAALLELNSLSVNKWKPHDISGEKGRLNLKDPFNGCYLFTTDNENGISVDIKSDIPNIAADFLYQKIVANRKINWDILKRAENAENADGTAEPAPGTTNISERSRRFLTFGIKRLAIPEDEIREFLTYKFARQVTLQMMFNNWSDFHGFTEETRNISFNEFVNQKETQEKWYMSDEHLSLSEGILADEINNQKWNTINKEWLEVIPLYKELIRNQDSKVWLDRLSELCGKRFDSDFRGVGVKKFYEIKDAARKDHAGEIRKRVEKELFDDWEIGARSIHEILSLLDALLESLEQRLNGMDSKIGNTKSNIESSENKIMANNKEWANIGVLSGLLGKKKRMFDAQATCLQEYYIYLTRNEALKFAKGLFRELISELSILRNEVSKCESIITDTVKELNKNIAQRCSDSGTEDLRRALVRFYDPTVVHEFAKNLIKDKRIQNTQSNTIRAHIIKQLGDKPDFSAFNNRMIKQRLLDILEYRCEEEAINAHTNILNSNPDATRLLGLNIIEKMYREFGGDRGRVRQFIQELVSSAGNYMIFDREEVNKQGDGIPSSPSKISMITVIMPKAQELSGFDGVMKEVFKESSDISINFIDSNVKENEITMISITNLFPLRFVKQLQFLKDKFDARVAGNSQRILLELFCEGDGTNHPSLFVPTEGELAEKGLPLLILAKVLNIIQEYKSPSTGKRELILPSEDKLMEPVRLGADIIDSLEKINAKNIISIKTTIEKILESDFKHEDKKGQLEEMIIGEVEMIKSERCNNDIDHPIYIKFREAGRNAIKLINKEN